MKNNKQFDESETIRNLARVFAGEVQDGARYQFLGQMAANEGYNYFQTLCKTLAKNEMAHAKAVYQLITNNCTKSISNIDCWEYLDYLTFGDHGICKYVG